MSKHKAKGGKKGEEAAGALVSLAVNTDRERERERNAKHQVPDMVFQGSGRKKTKQNQKEMWKVTTSPS